MSDPFITVSVDASDLEARLQRLQRVMGTGDHPALADGQRAAGAAYLAFVRSWFESAGDGTWPPLSEATLKAKAAKGEDLRPGFGNGSGMFDSLFPGHPNNVLEVNGWDTLAGSADPNIGYFHNGTRNSPPRPVFVEPDDAAREAIAAAQAEGVAECLREIFGRAG